MNRPMRVVGLDLSLTSTGLSDGRSTFVIQTKPSEVLEARLGRLVQGAMDFVLWSPEGRHQRLADLVVIEGASYGSKGSGVEQLSALRLMVRHRLWKRGVPFALISPSTLKTYTTGNGRASKPEMVAAVDARHGTDFAAVKLAHGRYDMADALGLAAMGYDHVGRPLTVDPAGPNRSSLDSVTWPGLLSDD